VVAAIARQLVDSARKIIAREWEGNMRDPLSHYHP
jgi:hypothetical protein